MQLNLPSPEQIYDLSTQQLSKLKDQLQIKIKNNKSNNSNDQIQNMKQFMQNIELQIQQRKTIQYFTQLCLNDGTANKYVKEITDFNNQFKKLANQLILNQQQNHENQRQTYQLQQRQQKSNKKYENDKNNISTQGRISHTSLNSQLSTNSTKYSIDNNVQNKTLQTQNSQNFTQTKSSVNKVRLTSTKKMGLGTGNMKKNTNKMYDFIRQTLNKTKAVQYVSGKGGMIKKSPQRNINHHNVHHTQSNNNNTGTPISTNKSIKTQTQTNINKRTTSNNITNTNQSNNNKNSSTSKNIPNSQKSIQINRDANIKKRNQAIQKLKTIKKTEQHSNVHTNGQNNNQIKKKSKQVGMNAKSLVEMVKMQQQAKKKKQEQPQIPKEQKKKQENKNIIIDQTKQLQKQISQHKSQINQSHQNQHKQKEKNQQLLLQSDSYDKVQSKQQKQKDFPIKQQINPIISSSDTQSQGQSLVKPLNKKIKSKKYEFSQQKYSSIPEEQIQQSIIIGKQTNSNNIKNNNINRQIQRKNEKAQIIKNQQIEKEKDIKNVVMKKNEKQIKQDRKIKENKQIIQQTQKFGNIVVEQYNPNGYQSQSQSCEQQLSRKDQQNLGEFKNQTSSNISKHKSTQYEDEKVFNTEIQQKQLKQKEKNGCIKAKNTKKKNIKKEDDDLIKLPQTQQIQKKMYNQQYWLHIKQEAQAKIQRFKQQKQLQKKQRQLKDKLLQEQKRKLKMQMGKNNLNNSKQQTQLTQNTQQDEKNKNITIQDDQNDKFIQQQKNNLKKIYSQNNANGTKKPSKKPTPASQIVKQPKLTYPVPQFNYLQIYPTFNHIFNVYHTKPPGQALLDIPLIMKDLISMFTDHLNFLKNRNNIFRPAIFLPFDNKKANHFSDARQLLQHAETTHVNLKTLVERLQIFNSNIQGAFQNCSEQEKLNTQHYRVVKTKQQVYDIITTSFLRRKGWKQLPHGQNLKANWNLFWSWSKPQIDMNKILTFQKVNHFPFNKNLSRKDLLYKNIDYFRKTHKVAFPYLPLTFNLPKQFTQFSKKFHEEQMINRDKNYWIMKPIGKSRGRGIKLINSLGDLNYLDNIVVQKYIANPLLIDGYKFDMRIYVLVTNFHPLEAFVYREGFARLSTEKYSLEPGDMKNNFVHLTNFAINRHNQQAADQFSGGSKISLKSLREKVTKMGYSFINVWSQVHQIIIKSLLACSVSVPPFPGAFELFGYDIMLDQDGQCHLIQINASPSLQRTYLIDQIVKQSLIDDIIEIVDPPNFSKEQIINVMNERLSPEFRSVKKGAHKINVEQQDLIHLARILKYQKLRRHGEMPEKIGLFEMVAPCQMSKDLQKLIKSKSGINNPHNID